LSVKTLSPKSKRAQSAESQKPELVADEQILVDVSPTKEKEAN